MAALKIELCRLDIRLIEIDGSLVLLNDIGLILGLLLGDCILLREVLVAPKIHLRLSKQAFVMCQLCTGLAKRCLVRPRIDQEQFLSLLHIVPRRELDLDDRASDARLHGDRIDGLRGTDGVDNIGNVPARRDGGRDWNCRRGDLGAGAARQRGAATEPLCGYGNTDENHEPDQNADAATRMEAL